ncbi:MAG: glycosyltransferase family 2 protein [bacterium]|nr:glycosyltransferase family 2 protein [bacterium]
MKYNLKQLDGVSLIIPVLNEEKTLKTLISKCSLQKVVKQLVIVNDGSTDNTKYILNQIAKRSKHNEKQLTTVIHHPQNMGKGAAIKTGLKYILGKYVMVQDADLEYSPADIRSLFNEAEKSKDGIIFGTRSRHRKKAYILARLGNWYLSLMYNVLFGFNLTDSYTCYKLMPRSIWLKLNLESNGFEIDSELISKLGINKFRIKEVPISYSPRKYSEGKKIKWTDLFKASWVALKIRLSNI